MSDTDPAGGTDLRFWRVTRDSDGIVEARFRNPPMNYFCAGAAQELGALIAAWQRPEVRAVILTGDPPGRFITHYSVEELLAFGADRAEMERIGTGLSDGYHALLRALRDLPKPVIAAISGDCMGGGLELALWCDFRIAQAGDFRLGLPEIHMGIMPGGSGTQMLGRLIGTARATRLILLGELLTPEAALDLGVVHYVSDDCTAFARQIARRLCALNAQGIAGIKAALHADTDLAGGLYAEACAFLDVMRSPAAMPGMERYLAVDPDQRRAWLERG